MPFGQGPGGTRGILLPRPLGSCECEKVLLRSQQSGKIRSECMIIWSKCMLRYMEIQRLVFRSRCSLQPCLFNALDVTRAAGTATVALLQVETNQSWCPLVSKTKKIEKWRDQFCFPAATQCFQLKPPVNPVASGSAVAPKVFAAAAALVAAAALELTRVFLSLLRPH